MCRVPVALFGFAAGLLGLTAHAATGTWAGDAAGNWSDTTKWTSGTLADGATFTANLTFNITAARTVTLDSARTIGTVNIGDLTTTSSSFTLALGANNLTFSNGGSAAVLAQNSTSNGDTISGASGGKLVIAGNGTLNVTNAASGKTLTISSGIISGLSSGTQTLNFNNANTVTVSGVIGDGATGGKIAVTQTGFGTTTLSTNNTFTGSITQSAGTLTLSGTNTAASVNLSGGTLNINNAGALGAGTLTISGGTINNSSAAAIINTGNNAQAWNGNFTFSGTRALDLGTGAVALGAANITTTVNGNSGTALTVGGNITGTGKSLTKAGTGTLILSGTNTYDGGTTINGGVLQFTHAGALAGSGQNLAVNYGGTAAFGYIIDQSFLTDRIVSGSEGTIGLGVSPSGDLDFSVAGLTKLSLGATGAGAVTYSGALWTPTDGIYRLGGGGGTLIFNPTLSGSNSLLVGGGGSGGSVTLVNAGTYSGATIVTGSVGSGNAAVGTAGGAGLLQTNVLAGASTTPFGTNTALTLNNGALGLGTAGALASGNIMNVTGYDVTYNGQNAINLAVGGGTSVTFAA
ncbi:MAG TPA: autotransporter-associated beta strand repeat-containing protein, partial [Roseimicrobium sp.]|nr:autotransporter-associated beta strand repeat-containing protein [Roseimicrobium sp.]